MNEPRKGRLEGLRSRRESLRKDLALHLLQGTMPPDRLPRMINQLRRTEIEVEAGA